MADVASPAWSLTRSERLYASRTWNAAKLASAASGTASVAANFVLIVSLRLTCDPSPRVPSRCTAVAANGPLGWVVGSRRLVPKRDVTARAGRSAGSCAGLTSRPRDSGSSTAMGWVPRLRRRARIASMARRSALSSWLYKASRTTRDFEVLSGKNGAERYAKRRIRRVARRRGLGWWFRKTGL